MQRATTRRTMLAGMVGGGVTLIEESLSLSPGAARRTDRTVPKPPPTARRDRARRNGDGSTLVLGAFHPGMPGDPSSLDDFKARYGRAPGLVMWFQAWGDPQNKHLDLGALDRVNAAGAIPMITWEPWIPAQGADQPDYALAKIAKGDFDKDIVDPWARQLAGWNDIVLLRFAHEMNGDWYPWSVADGTNRNAAADYVDAWRHVHDRFQSADNVRWVWAPNVEYGGSYKPLADLYPGDDYVDWIGMDGYNWAGSRSSSNWRSLGNVFGPTYDALTAAHPDKPIMIAETGCPGSRPDKASWIRKGLLSTVPRRFPNLSAVTYFDAKTDRDWRANTSGDIRKAFSAVVKSDRYRGALPNS